MLNKVILMGRLTRDPEIRYSQDGNTAIARFSMAVERDFSREKVTDFINCVAFGKTAEFVEKYFFKGNMIAVVGRIQTGSYTNKDGQKVYTTDVAVENVSFTGEKNNGNNGSDRNTQPAAETYTDKDGFMNIPDGIEEELPFS